MYSWETGNGHCRRPSGRHVRTATKHDNRLDGRMNGPSWRSFVCRELYFQVFKQSTVGFVELKALPSNVSGSSQDKAEWVIFPVGSQCLEFSSVLKGPKSHGISGSLPETGINHPAPGAWTRCPRSFESTTVSCWNNKTTQKYVLNLTFSACNLHFSGEGHSPSLVPPHPSPSLLTINPPHVLHNLGPLSVLSLGWATGRASGLWKPAPIITPQRFLEKKACETKTVWHQYQFILLLISRDWEHCLE